MEASEEPGFQLQQAAAAWLDSQHSALLAQEPAPAALLLEAPVIDLACGAHAEVAAALLADPERLRQAAIAALTEAGLLAPGQRLWLRPTQLPTEWEQGVGGALATLRAAPGALLACHGVCVAASAPFQAPAARAFQCASCAKVCTLHSMDAPPPCCGGPLLEVDALRVMVPAQVMFLAPDRPLGTEPAPHLGAGLLAVQLLDDLVGSARVGDRVLVTGPGRYWGGGGAAAAAGAALPLTLGVQLEACNVQVLHPSQLAAADELLPGTRQHLAALSGGGLKALLDTLDAAVPEAAVAPPLLKLALLLSAAAAGTGRAEVAAPADADAEPETFLRRRLAGSRHQVHVMLTSAGPEPPVQRLLGALASALTDHSVRGVAGDPRRLLPCLDARWVDPVLGVPAPLALGGQLAEASAGVLLLSSSTLDTKRAIGLGQYVAAGEAVLEPGCPELVVPVGATLWTTMHEQDLTRPGRVGSTGGGGGLSLTERIINKFSQPFFAQHDVLLAAGAEGEEAADALADAILLSAAGPPSAASSRARADALAALAHHVGCARAGPQPALGEEAAGLLGAYFAHLRAHEEAQAGVLASLVRVACAAARLRRSSTVQQLPDAALAVAYLEEKLAAAGRDALFWPRWRAELARCTPLGECLRGLAEDCAAGLQGLGCCGGSGGGAAAAWAERAEE